jgi:poly(A) polymerase
MEPIIVPRSEHPISRKLIDADAVKVLYRLHRAGYQAYLVGGGVRDLLLDRHPKDFDISTDAHPHQVKRLFRNCRLIGRRFRLAHVHFGEKILEVSTFRKRSEPGEDADTEDILIRSDNTFGTAEEDSLRRDFTINGLFYDISNFSLIDYVGGLADLNERMIRTIGDPDIRFREDPVRMIRAVKFAARLDFGIDRASWRRSTACWAVARRSSRSGSCSRPACSTS